MLALLGKVRKMKDKASLQGKELLQIFAYLGGWKVVEDKAFENPRKIGYYAKEELTHSFVGDQDKVEAERNRIKKDEVEKLPDPSSLPLGKRVYLDVSEIGPMNGKLGFSYTEMMVHPTVIITSPERKSFTLMNKDLEQFPSEYMGSVRTPVLKWLDTTSFYNQVNSKLGTVSIEEERELAKKKIPTRDNTGTCPCCFGNFKLTKKARNGSDLTLPGMVLHGYSRPGNGYIQGNCQGQDWPPFELAKECTEKVLSLREHQLVKEKGNLLRWETDPPNAVSEYSLFNKDMKEYRKEDMSEYDWGQKVKARIHKIKGIIQDLTTDIRFLGMRLKGWKVLPLPGTGPTPLLLLRGFQVADELLHAV